MEKKYYIIPTIKVKEMEAEGLMQDGSIQIYTETDTDPVKDGTEVGAKPMYGDFNVWEK